MSKKIRVLVLRVMQAPVVEEIDSGLKAAKAIVGGWIQAVPLDRNVDLICNEEGKLLGLPPNRPIFDGADIVCGDCFVSRVDDEGETISLTDEDINKYTEQFSTIALSFGVL